MDELIAKLEKAGLPEGQKKLGHRQRALLLEALRRYTRHHKGELLTLAWTGLGYESLYRSVADAGLMRIAPGTSPARPRCMAWWSLTEKGAAIVQGWLDAGITHEDLEIDRSGYLHLYELVG